MHKSKPARAETHESTPTFDVPLVTDGCWERGIKLPHASVSINGLIVTYIQAALSVFSVFRKKEERERALMSLEDKSGGGMGRNRMEGVWIYLAKML